MYRSEERAPRQTNVKFGFENEGVFSPLFFLSKLAKYITYLSNQLYSCVFILFPLEITQAMVQSFVMRSSIVVLISFKTLTMLVDVRKNTYSEKTTTHIFRPL